ncbi:MAG: MOSC domain-containing protein [Acidiferrobacterales bacterium]
MKLLSVNVSLPKEISYQGRTVTTCIFKEPVEGRVMVRRLNVDGDDQADRRVHGVGFEMAVYFYPVEHYAFWEKELGRDGFPYGQFGENFTVEGLSEETVHVGDIFRVGAARLQVTQPRIPCYKLAMRMGEGPDFPARFQATGRMGFYCRVLEEGAVGAGDAIELIERDDGSVTMAEFIQVYLHESHEPESLKRVLASRDLGEPWRVYLEKMLKKAEPVMGPRGWEGFRAFSVDRKVPESETITSFYLKPQDGEALPAYLPGQFLTFRLSIPEHPKPVTRTYSLSDSPNHPDYYRVSIKRLPAPADQPSLPPGLSSNYFHDHVQAGTRLCVMAPRGKFYLDPDDDAPVVLLSGGVGLTPMISMLNAIVESGSERTVWFVHGTRDGGEHAMGAHIRRLATEKDHIHVHVSYSQPRPEDAEGRDYDNRGHVSVELLKKVLPPAAYDFYLCGPTPFMKSLYNGLLEWGVAETRINYEFFGPASALKEGAEAARKPAAAAGSDVELEVSFAKAGLTAMWDPSLETILDFAEAQGLRPDFSCRTGICHTCMSKLIEGEVEYVTEPLDMPDPGCVLICCSRPRTNVVVDV